MLKRLFFCLILVLCCGAKHPELSPQEVSKILRDMMEAHVSYKNLCPELLGRTIALFIEELDPTKTYFLASEIKEWEELPLEKLDILAEGISLKEDFDVFFNIHELMLNAIERRTRLERRIERRPPSDLSSNGSIDLKHLQSMQWANDEEELSQRLIDMHALHIKAVSQLEKAHREKALARIAKKRLSRELDIKGHSAPDQKNFIFCTILKAFASAFDSHTCYFTPAEAARFMVQVQQRLFGIGVQLRDDLNGFTVVKVVEGGPASQGTGLKNGDRIIAINGEPVVGLEILDAVELVRGEEGSKVQLTVLREGISQEERHEITVIRGEVLIKESRIESKLFPFADGSLVVISLHSFYQDPIHSSSADLYEEIMNIRKEHLIKGMIIDLRDNTGGVLPQAINVAGLFITKGIIASIKDHMGRIEHLREIDGKMTYDGPLVILTSKASASAAEIVAQSLQDYGRAIVVGDEYTFGKGTFQTFSLDSTSPAKINPKGELKITRGRYYTVSGKSPQLVGVKPDIFIPGVLSHSEIGEQYHKNPLPNDSIAENFQDDLSDIPAMQRDQISWLYRFNLQSRLKMYQRLIPQLAENSRIRIAEDMFYQQFLTDLQQENYDYELIARYLKADPQLKEALNVLKDLIVLLN